MTLGALFEEIFERLIYQQLFRLWPFSRNLFSGTVPLL